MHRPLTLKKQISTPSTAYDTKFSLISAAVASFNDKKNDKFHGGFKRRLPLIFRSEKNSSKKCLNSSLILID